MTDPIERVTPSSAAELEEQAAQWIERRDFAAWSTSDKDELEIWLSQSLANRVAFDRLDLGWQKAERLSALGHSKSFRQSPAEPAQKTHFWVKSASAAAFAAMAAFGWLTLSPESEAAYATSIGGREIIRLADGSQIELNTNTAVRIASRRDGRDVWLDRGEAYFQVVHDPARPFVVHFAGGRVTDIGTKFSVRREIGQVQVAVTEGKVQVASVGNFAASRPMSVTAGEIAVATPQGIKLESVSPSTLSNSLAWRSGVLVFHHTRLADAVAELNRYNESQIRITDSNIADLEIGGTFPTTDVEAFVDVARDVLHLHVTKDSSSLRISR